MHTFSYFQNCFINMHFSVTFNIEKMLRHETTCDIGSEYDWSFTF